MTAPWREARNAAARVRLAAARPVPLPAPVLVHAVACRVVPDLPRRAVESYWQAHPLRADRLARALAARSGAPEGWRWRVSAAHAPGLPATFRLPPTPYREPGFDRGPGQCCLCGQPVFRFGWHRDLWGDGTVNRRARWHAACVAAWKLWVAPTTQVGLLGRLQARRCALTGTRLLRGAEADHRMPLHRVWREARERPWPDLLASWGFPNLQAVNAAPHRAKSAAEARGRAAVRLDAAQSASV